MGQYTPTNHAELLAEHALAYRQPEYIAEELVPSSLVESKLVKYYKYTRADASRITDAEMASDGMPNQRKFSATSVEVSLDPFGLFDRIPISDINSQSDGGDLEMDTVEDLTDDLMLSHEKRVSDLVMTAANYAAANRVTLGTPWTNKTSGTPITDIQTGMRACALRPNVLTLDEVSWDALRSHPDIVQVLRGTGGQVANGLASLAEVAEYFELEKVLVGRAKYNSANPGATEAYSYIWPTGRALLARQPSAPRRRELMLVRNYKLNQAGNGGAGGYAVTTLVEEQRGTAGTLFVKVAGEEKTVLVAADAGYLISSAA